MRKLLTTLVGCLLFVIASTAQTRKISGIVQDEGSKPIPNASILIKGSGTGTSADSKGSFSISVKPGDVLVISAIGFTEQEIKIGTQTSVSVSLQKTTLVIEEVVVTAQGLKRRPKELGFSIATISNTDINLGKSPQLANGLSGKVSGLAIFNVNNSVDPAVKINLRGYRSITGSNDALIVIDGLPQPAGSSTILNQINPNDIESVSILKGGQAAILYGSDGVNGAVVITTKKGTKGKTKVSYSHFTNVEEVSFLPEYQDKYGSGSHYATAFGQPTWKPNYLDRMEDNWRSYENQQYGAPYDGSMRVAGRTLEDGTFLTLPYSPISGERKRIWDKGLTTNNQVSISGGTDQSTFYVSLENNLTRGILPGDLSKRTGARFSSTTESGRFKAGFTASYIQVLYDRSTFDFYNEAINQAAHIPLSTLKDWRNNKYASPNGYYNDYFTNPYFRLDNDRQKYQDGNVTANLELSYKLTDWLTLYDKINVMNNSRTGKNTQGKFIHSDWAKTKAVVPAPFDRGDGAGITRALTDVLGSVNDYSSSENIINNEFQVQVNKTFGDYSIKGTVGHSVYERRTKSIGVASASIVVPEVYNIDNRLGNLTGSESINFYRKLGLYADALIGWKDKIFLHGSVRMDQSSRAFKADRPTSMYTYVYPGVDAAAILTDLVPSIKGNILSYAKLRASFSRNANESGLNNYALDATYPNSSNFPYGNTVGITVGNTLPDIDLKPEFTNSIEFGGDFQFFKGRLGIELTSYSQKSTGQIVTVTVPQSTGFSGLKINVGETENWGFEADVKYQVVKQKKWDVDLSVRYAYNDNKIVKLYQGVPQFLLAGYAYANAYVLEGRSFPRMNAIGYVRDDQNRIVVNKANGYPLNTGPLTDFGRTTPPHILGAGTRIRYTDFTLSANFEYRGGNVIYSDLGRQMTFSGSGKWTEDRAPFVVPNSSYFDGTKYVPNDVKAAEAEYEYYYTYYRVIAENFVTPAWFIKLRDLNLSYSIPVSILGKAKIFSGASIGLFGRNLFTIVDDANQFTDPEFSFTAGNGLGVNNTSQTPPTKQYGFSVTLNFK
jgi:TonB-linked SusC/RagA family outer membrane protein